MIASEPKASTPKGTRRWTYTEMVARLPEANLPTELWDGELVMSPASSFFHQEIVDRFHDFLKKWVRDQKLGKTAIAPVDMVLAPRRVMQPDVVFISKDRLETVGEYVNGPADLVAEVLSPGTRRHDCLEKRDLYEQHGIKEYWLIDPEAQTIEVLFLDRGEYRLVGRWRAGGTAESRLIKGSKVSIAELFPGA